MHGKGVEGQREALLVKGGTTTGQSPSCAALPERKHHTARPGPEEETRKAKSQWCVPSSQVVLPGPHDFPGDEARQTIGS